MVSIVTHFGTLDDNLLQAIPPSASPLLQILGQLRKDAIPVLQKEICRCYTAVFDMNTGKKEAIFDSSFCSWLVEQLGAQEEDVAIAFAELVSSLVDGFNLDGPFLARFELPRLSHAQDHPCPAQPHHRNRERAEA